VIAARRDTAHATKDAAIARERELARLAASASGGGSSTDATAASSSGGDGAADADRGNEEGEYDDAKISIGDEVRLSKDAPKAATISDQAEEQLRRLVVACGDRKGNVFCWDSEHGKVRFARHGHDT